MLKDKADFLPSSDVIIEEVSKFYGIEADAIRGQGRTKDTALARQIAMYQIRRITTLSLKEIGREFDNRDHTTVMHSIERIEKLIKTNPEIAEVENHSVICPRGKTSSFSTRPVDAQFLFSQLFALVFHIIFPYGLLLRSKLPLLS